MVELRGLGVRGREHSLFLTKPAEDHIAGLLFSVVPNGTWDTSAVSTRQ